MARWLTIIFILLIGYIIGVKMPSYGKMIGL